MPGRFYFFCKLKNLPVSIMYMGLGSQPVYGWEILRTKRSCSFLKDQSCLFMMAHFLSIDKCLSAEDFPASGKSCPIIVEKKWPVVTQLLSSPQGFLSQA
jgi:hypothetical protein